MNTKRGLAVLLLVCLLLVTMLCGCGSKTAPAGSAESTPSAEALDPNRDWEPIETKFGTLCFPDQFFDYLETEQNETDNTVSVRFVAKVSDQRIELFELLIGDGDGTVGGKLTGPDGIQRDVHVKLLDLPELTGLTDGETNRVYAMQEAVNDVLDHLS